MARYKVKRKVGLGFVYYTLPTFGPDDEIKKASLTINPNGYNAVANQELAKYEVGSPGYNEVITKRDDDFVKLLDFWKVPYTRDNNFSATPVNDVQITNEKGTEVPIQTVLADPNASVVITEEIVDGNPKTKDNTMLYVGIGILAVGAAIVKTKKKKK